MFWRASIVVVTILLWTLVAQAIEQQLGGIRIGMKPDEVMEVLGDPTAFIMAQPPFEERSTGLGIGDGLGGGLGGLDGGMTGEGESVEDKPNTLIFLYQNREVELGASSAASAVASPFGAQPQSSGSGASIPIWAYTVRVLKLALNQQQFIYKINDTYSIGITITGQGPEARVSDIVACSFEPLTQYPTNPTRKKKREDINFYYPAIRKYLPAGTSKGVVLGSRLAEVLKAHKWPQFFFPFVTNELATIKLSNNPALPDVPAGISGGGSASPAGGGGLPSPMDGAGGGQSAAGEKIATFLDGKELNISAGFTKNCLLLYPADQVALTFIDFTLVRIQIGRGVVPPPKPSVRQSSAN